MRAEVLPQRRVHQVGGAVVALDVPPARARPRQPSTDVGSNGSRKAPPTTVPCSGPCAPGRRAVTQPSPRDEAGVAHLAARLRVEGVLAQQELDARSPDPAGRRAISVSASSCW